MAPGGDGRVNCRPVQTEPAQFNRDPEQREGPGSSAVPGRRRARPAQLWLAVHLPQLPLEALTGAAEDERARVIIEGAGVRQQVLSVNSTAMSLGIRPGMPVSAAHALGLLHTIVRDERAEESTLNRLALWAMRFTPAVSLVSPDGLLLEVRGSLKLFGGIEPLLRCLRHGLSELGHAACLAVAPTPMAAGLLARARTDAVVMTAERLRGELARVPVTHLRLPEQTTQALQQVGIRMVHECLRLPRAGLARRFSPLFVQCLDQISGALDDPRPRVPLPATFMSELSLPWEISDSVSLMKATQRLLNSLGGYLQARCAATRLLHWHFRHTDKTASEIHQSLAAPQSDPRHIADLLGERLTRISFSSPVHAASLRVEQFVERQAHNESLFTQSQPGDGVYALSPSDEADRMHAFLDRLQARLGDNAVVRLATHPDYRPERAWRQEKWGLAPLPQKVDEADALIRPLWLLRRPQLLQMHAATPLYDGPLTLLSERERIESGWWDGHHVVRDYYRASTRSGDHLWVFRDLQQHRQWSLQGLFA